MPKEIEMVEKVEEREDQEITGETKKSSSGLDETTNKWRRWREGWKFKF